MSKRSFAPLSLLSLAVALPLAISSCKTSPMGGGANDSAQDVADGGKPGDAPKRRDRRLQNRLGLTGTTTAGGDPGALIATSMSSKVGVLLDEVPLSIRDRVAAALIAKPADFWVQRAKRQINLTTYRLVFRSYFYKAGSGKNQLPIPPDSVWNVTLSGTPFRDVNGTHDAVSVNYNFNSTLLSTADSPARSEPNLATIGGTWDEPFILPLDPELVFQRTGYACMDEAEFPPNSVDSEEVDSFYDQTCGVEKEPSMEGCHQTVLPTSTCVQAVNASIGSVKTQVHFVRLPWNAATADQVRVGPLSTTAGADLQVVQSEFHINRTIYRYFQPSACELVEQCIGAPGWRRLLQFATADRNTGNHTLNIGAVDYQLTGVGGPTLNDVNHIFEYSSCHKHYHFTHYGSFSYGGNLATTTKRGFCLQSTDRFSNIEVSPLDNAYAGCEYQGVEAGWVDEYKAGLPCQWIDVTNVDTSGAPVTQPLTFVSNPDGFLCEGTPVLDANGNQVYEPTSFRTASGDVVNRPKCNFAPNWNANNTDSYNVTLQKPGEGYVTAACAHGQIGPLRNCGFANTGTTFACTPGQTARLTCSLPQGAAPQAVRVCDYSAKMHSGVACTNADSLNSAVVAAGNPSVTFACPAAKDANEPGGTVSLYTAPVYDGDAAAAVTCTLN
jgi:hypothetical protein